MVCPSNALFAQSLPTPLHPWISELLGFLITVIVFHSSPEPAGPVTPRDGPNSPVGGNHAEEEEGRSRADAAARSTGTTQNENGELEKENIITVLI